MPNTNLSIEYRTKQLTYLTGKAKREGEMALIKTKLIHEQLKLELAQAAIKTLETAYAKAECEMEQFIDEEHPGIVPNDYKDNTIC